jgi:hypothetical protein
MPNVPVHNWRRMMLSGAAQLRDLLLSHPGLIPVIIRRRAMGMGSRMLDGVAGRLLEARVPVGAIAPMFDALERFVVGWAVRETTGEVDADAAAENDALPNLEAAAAMSSISGEQLFDISCLAIIDAIAESGMRPLPAAVGARTRNGPAAGPTGRGGR